MDSEMKYYMDESFEENSFAAKKTKTEEINEDIQTILDLYSLLSLEEKLIARRLLINEKLF